MIELRDDFREYLGNQDAFDKILALDGKVFRMHKNRRTFRIVQDGKGYFIKTHRGVGLKETFKNLLQLRLPIFGAQNEAHAIKRLQELGIDTMTMVGFGVRGLPPVWLHSFIITEELTNTVSLEDFTRSWSKVPPEFSLKLAITKKIAFIARHLHQNGVNHRDFYICHFFLDLTSMNETRNYEDLKIFLIDLHRVQQRQKTPQRWIIKDLAGLFFSSMDIGLTQRDIFRFMKYYSEKPLRDILKEERELWNKVYKRARKLYVKHFQHFPEY